MITIRDVARECGFSPSTVSIVLNNSPLARYIPRKTKDHVKRIARTLGYHPNEFARSLRSQRSHTVGIMVPDITDPYCTQILRGIETSLYRSGYLPVLTDIQNDRERFKSYVGLLLERRVEGLILLANSLLLETDLLAAFEKPKIPMVIIGRDSQSGSISSVIIDNEVGTYAGMEHLYSLGHRQIAFIKGPKKVVDSSQRWKGICAFAEHAGLKLDRQSIVELKEPASSNEGGYRATQELLKRKQPFTALMSFDDMTAFGAIRALSDAGLKTPQDCSVVGFDDVAAAAFYNPSLTTIRQPMEKLGVIGVGIFLEAVNGTAKKKPMDPVRRKIEPELVVRESTAAIGRR